MLATIFLWVAGIALVLVTLFGFLCVYVMLSVSHEFAKKGKPVWALAAAYAGMTMMISMIPMTAAVFILKAAWG